VPFSEAEEIRAQASSAPTRQILLDGLGKVIGDDLSQVGLEALRKEEGIWFEGVGLLALAGGQAG
jgi:hypothetical protein